MGGLRDVRAAYVARSNILRRQVYHFLRTAESRLPSGADEEVTPQRETSAGEAFAPLADPAPQSSSTRITCGDQEYDVVKKLGRGCRADVYLVRAAGGASSSLDQQTAYALRRLKEANPTCTSREVETLRRFAGNPFVVQVITSDIPRSIILMEAGELSFFKHKEPLQFWPQTLRALQAIHAASLVWLDAKPENFIIIGGRVKAIDIGEAWLCDGQRTLTAEEADSLEATPQYGAPELLAETVVISPSADVWSLGMILWFCLKDRWHAFGKKAVDEVLEELEEPSFTLEPRIREEFRDSEAMTLLLSSMVTDPRDRMSIESMLDHPFTRSLSQPATT